MQTDILNKLIRNFKEKLSKINRFEVNKKEIITDNNTCKVIGIEDLTCWATYVDVIYNSFTDEYYVQICKDNDEWIYSYIVCSLPYLDRIIRIYDAHCKFDIQYKRQFCTFNNEPAILLPCCNKVLLLRFESKSEIHSAIGYHLGQAMIFNINYKPFSLIQIPIVSNITEIVDAFIVVHKQSRKFILQPFTSTILLLQTSGNNSASKILYNVCL